MQKLIDNYIPHATHLIAGKEGEKIVIEEVNHRMSEDGKKVAGEFRGYISSFGASLVQAGLLPTLAFYADKQAKSAKHRWRILIVLYHLIKDKERWQGRFSQGSAEKKLLNLALDLQEKKEHDNLRHLQKDVKNAAIALKLALRTYELTKENQHNDE